MRDLLRVEVLDAANDAARVRPLPSEEELMAQLSVPREMVREVLALLVDEGMLVRRRGLGTRIAGKHSELSVLLPRGGTTLEAFYGLGPIEPRVLAWEWVELPRAVAARLDDVSVGDRVLCIDYVFVQADAPVCVATNYVRAPEGSRLDRAAFTTDFYALLSTAADGGLGSHDMVFESGRSDAYVARLLGVEPGAPVSTVHQVIRDASGVAIDVAVIHFRAGVRLSLGNIPQAGPPRA